MSKKLGTILAGAGLATASLFAVAGPAHAAQWTVSPGGAVTANIAPLTKVIAKDPLRGTQAACSSASGAGTAVSGTVPNGNGLVSVTSLSASNCIGPANAAVNVTMTNLPYSMNGASYAAGVTTGTVTGIKATYSNPVDGCVATVTGPGGAGGSVNGTYTNATGRLVASGGSTLQVATVNGLCSPTQIQVGDPITLTGTLIVTPLQTVTSP
jgi:hypothetical protein